MDDVLPVSRRWPVAGDETVNDGIFTSNSALPDLDALPSPPPSAEILVEVPAASIPATGGPFESDTWARLNVH